MPMVDRKSIANEFAHGVAPPYKAVPNTSGGWEERHPPYAPGGDVPGRRGELIRDC